MVTDTVSDFLIQLKNASSAGKASFSYTYSKLVLAIAELLAKENYISSIEKKTRKGKKMIDVTLAAEGRERIGGIRRVSKPSVRVYTRFRNLRLSKSHLGHLVLSTPKGIMTDRTAKREKVGGEILFKIW
jgi:small subunit ribosomal protein S8